MNMTTEKLAEMKRGAQDILRDNHIAYTTLPTTDFLSLIALAERALEPQGQALPELPPAHRMGNLGTPLYTADDMHAYARAYASQLALPAGPVPELRRAALLEAERNSALEEAATIADKHGLTGFSAANDIRNRKRFAPEVKDYTHRLEDALFELIGKIDPDLDSGDMLEDAKTASVKLDASPAVAQHDNTAAWESGELGRSDEHAKRAPAEIERQIAEAVAQPVADENAEWIAQAKLTLDRLGSFLQRIGAPHAVAWRDWIDNAERHVLAMSGAQPVADERDLARYRFLRSVAGMSLDELRAVQKAMDIFPDDDYRIPTPEDFDASVDAGMATHAALGQPAEEGGKS